MQPYFMPYIGYFQLINIVDKYIIYDDVQFIKGGWINRNNTLVGGAKKMFTISLEAASSNKLINEIKVADNFIKLRKNLLTNYAKAPYLKEVISILDRISEYENKNLGAFIGNSIKEVSRYMGINTEFIYSSSLNKNCALKGEDKIISICKELGAKGYINAIGGQELYNKDNFAKHDIELKFIQTGDIVYDQLTNNFVPFLSILDVLAFNSVDDVKVLLNKFSLI